MLRRFLTSQSGVVSTSTIIMIPLLFWAYAAMYVFWDAFKTQNLATKTTFTISDLISREVTAIDRAYLDGLHDLIVFLNPGRGPALLRISVVRNVLDEDTGAEAPTLQWSEVVGDWPEHTSVADLSELLPLMAVGEELIVVETVQQYEPLFRVGVTVGSFYNVSVTRPRYTPALPWSAAGA